MTDIQRYQFYFDQFFVQTKMHVRQMRQKAVSQLDKYIIIDTHGGQEDIIGLVVTIKLAQKYDRTILGITCCTGRRDLSNAVKDVLRAQEIAGSSIPVFRGSTRSLMLRRDYPPCINLGTQFEHLNSFPISPKTQKLQVQSQSAASFISSAIKAHGDQLCFVSFGPLTNLALAFHLTQCSGYQKQLSSLRVNGGSYTGVGNAVGVPSSQGNFYFDAEAAHIIVTNYQNIYVNPIERTIQTSLKQQISDILKNCSQVKENQWLTKILDWLATKQFSTCGPLLTILGIFNRLITNKILDVYTEVMRTGYQTQGLMAPNWLRLEVEENQQAPNTKIYTDVDRKILKKMLWQALS